MVVGRRVFAILLILTGMVVTMTTNAATVFIKGITPTVVGKTVIPHVQCIATMGTKWPCPPMLLYPSERPPSTCKAALPFWAEKWTCAVLRPFARRMIGVPYWTWVRIIVPLQMLLWLATLLLPYRGCRVHTRP